MSVTYVYTHFSFPYHIYLLRGKNAIYLTFCDLFNAVANRKKILPTIIRPTILHVL